MKYKIARIFLASLGILGFMMIFPSYTYWPLAIVMFILLETKSKEKVVNNKREAPPVKNTKTSRFKIWNDYSNGKIDLTDLVNIYSKMGVKVIQINASEEGSKFQCHVAFKGKEEWVE